MQEMPPKFVSIQIPLVELSSDSEGASVPPQPPHVPSPAASHTLPDPHTPRYVPTVSDDDEDPEAPPGYGVPSPDSSRRPTRRSPTPPPRQLHQAAPAPRPMSVPRAPIQPRMSVGPRPHYQLAARDYPPDFPPRPMYERGESSRQPDYTRHLDAISAQMRDTRYAFYELQGTQGRMMDRMGEFEQNLVGWKKTVEDRTYDLSAGVQGSREELARRMSTLERLMWGAGVFAVLAVLVGLLPYFLRG